MGDRVFIADYIKKKRRRKGNIEYLVKWKGYPTRHCTWEPQENILDDSLIRQFDEEGYDPRRVRAACRKKKRRRSEITEARSFILPFSDSDSEHERSSHDLLSTHKSKVTPVSLSKYGGVWQTDATNEKLDTLFEKDTEAVTEQRKRDAGNDIIDNKENALCRNESSLKDCGTLHKNGGKSCHPKMRAKFMFRSGDFEKVDWGSCNDWTSSDNESTRGITNKEINQDIYGLTLGDYENPAKRRRLSTFSIDLSSTTSESTIPAIEELDSPITNNAHSLSIGIHTLQQDSTLTLDNHTASPEYEYSRPNSCPYLESSFSPQSCETVEDTSAMPVLTNEAIVEHDEAELLPTATTSQGNLLPTTQDQSLPTTQDQSLPTTQDQLIPMAQDQVLPIAQNQLLPTTQDQLLPVEKDELLQPTEEKLIPTTQETTEDVGSQKQVTDEVKTRDNVFVTEVTLENLTVIIQECERTKGFFKWDS